MDICQAVPEAIPAWLTKGNMSDETALIKKRERKKVQKNPKGTRELMQ